MAYNNNVPLATQTKAQTQAPILDNFKYIETTLQVEHQFNTGATTQGVHKQCSMANQSTPAVPAGCNGVYYVDGGNAWFSNGGNQFQLSFPSQPSLLGFNSFTGVTAALAPAAVENVKILGVDITGAVMGMIILYRDTPGGGSTSWYFMQNGTNFQREMSGTGSNNIGIGWVAGALAIQNNASTIRTIHYVGWFQSVI